MAKRRSTTTKATRTPKATSRRPAKPAAAAATEVEVVEEEAGEGIDSAILILTTVLLVGAWLFVDALLGRYGEGMFF